jgi:phospholipase/carboxylesterase
MSGTNQSGRVTGAERGLLSVDPPEPVPSNPSSSRPRGLQRLDRGGRRDGVLLVPQGYDPATPIPLLVLLHGAGGEGIHMISTFAPQAEDRGFIILSPDSRGGTWDIIYGAYGPDVMFVDGALEHLFEGYSIDRRRIGVGGFSDGASYALSLGLGNGGLFRHILAFSPGFAAPRLARGNPKIFVSHGVRDEVLPIESCSRRLVPRLRNGGYDVDYREFPDGHIMPGDLVQAGVERFLA